MSTETNNQPGIINAPTPIPKAQVMVGSLFNPVSNKSLPREVEVYEAKERGEIVLDSDQLESIVRHVLIGANAFGIHQIKEIALFAGVTTTRTQEILAEHGSKLKDGVYCLTKPEILARLSIIACKSTDNNKLRALQLLSEFRGTALPEGGSRNFKRTIMKFATGQ